MLIGGYMPCLIPLTFAMLFNPFPPPTMVLSFGMRKKVFFVWFRTQRSSAETRLEAPSEFFGTQNSVQEMNFMRTTYDGGLLLRRGLLRLLLRTKLINSSINTPWPLGQMFPGKGPFQNSFSTLSMSSYHNQFIYSNSKYLHTFKPKQFNSKYLQVSPYSTKKPAQTSKYLQVSPYSTKKLSPYSTKKPAQTSSRQDDWQIIKGLVTYLWPKNDYSIKFRVVLSLALLISGKLLNVMVFRNQSH